MGRAGDVLSIVEASYADAGSEREWLRALVEAATPVLDTGIGISATSFVHRGSTVEYRESVWTGPLAEFVSLERMHDAVEAQSKCLSREAFARLYPSRPEAATFRRLAGPAGPEILGRMFPPEAPFVDALGVIGSNPSGVGAMLMAMSRSVLAPSASTLALWTRVAAHLAAGYRLRQAENPAVDAVLTPAGRVEHLDGEAPQERASLSEATRAIDQARGKMRRADPERAVAIWQGLVAGRWSLVDQFDSDGRRYVVAKRNAPEVAGWKSLSEMENRVLAFAAGGQPHKIIAYELGISVAGVASHIRRAARKVGAGSRLELVARFRSAQAEGSP
jgi:DNA-binding CsgD family transcriptional regulator